MFKIQILKNNVVTNEAKFQTQEQANEWYEFNKDYFLADHVKQVTSLADEILEKKRDQESDEAVELGTKVIKAIRKANRRKLKTGVWDQAKFTELLTNQTAYACERALWNGSLGTAKYLLTNLSAFYSDIEIAEIIIMIDAHEAKWASLI